MYNFCTLFDSNYFSRGLAMYRSLKRYCPDFHLYIFSFDGESFELLNKMKLTRATVIALDEFEDENLLSVKPDRTKAEYCWTATSSTILYALNRFGLEMCTYLDADLFFFGDPGKLLEEMGTQSVMITEHRYTPEYDQSSVSGKYCVQFISFKNDERGLKVLNWWRDACLDWCYARVEEGKFGDQKYLDGWLERFEGVHEMEHLGGGVAPWNVQQYNISVEGEKRLGTEKKTGMSFEIIFYHFHHLRFYENNFVGFGNYRLSKNVRDLLYRPYMEQIEEVKKEVREIHEDFIPNETSYLPGGLKNRFYALRRKIRGKYYMYDQNKFLKG